jgi:putative SOS response-associated peptidase YedK
MCGRYYITEETKKELEKLVRDLERKINGAKFDGDIVPSAKAPILFADGKEISATMGRWGFPGAQGKNLIINARAETAQSKSMFSNCLSSGRCVIPAAGFYEWDRSRNKFTFTGRQSNILYLAGIYRKGEQDEQFVVLTTQANASMERVHPRMPLILNQNQMKEWLMQDVQTDRLLKAVPEELQSRADMEQMRLEFI